MPYLKRGFQVEDLPENIEFKKPYYYGSVQLKKIILAQNEIKFKLDKKDSSKTFRGEPIDARNLCLVPNLFPMFIKPTWSAQIDVKIR